jgi:hypothetical protein
MRIQDGHQDKVRIGSGEKGVYRIDLGRATGIIQLGIRLLADGWGMK